MGVQNVFPREVFILYNNICFNTIHIYPKQQLPVLFEISSLLIFCESMGIPCWILRILEVSWAIPRFKIGAHCENW